MKNVFFLLFDFFPPFELDFSNQPTAPAFVLATALAVPKHTEKNLQRSFKTILEVRASITSKKPWNKLLKVCSLDVYCGKFYMKCYNLCQ